MRYAKIIDLIDDVTCQFERDMCRNEIHFIEIRVCIYACTCIFLIMVHHINEVQSFGWQDAVKLGEI